MSKKTRHEFLREMVSLSYRCAETAGNDEDREFYREVENRWRERLAKFEEQKNAA